MPRKKRKPQTLLLVTHEPLEMHTENQLEIARWRKPREVAVLGDLFAPEVPFDFIHSSFWVMEVFTKHLFIISTQHWQRWCDLQSSLPTCRNVIIEAAHEGESDD